MPSPQRKGLFQRKTYVVVEVGIFGQPDAGIKLSLENFRSESMERMIHLPSQPFGLVGKSLKDPDSSRPPLRRRRRRTSLNGGGGGGQVDSNAPPAPVHVPIEVQRSMQQRVQKAALPGGRPHASRGRVAFFHIQQGEEYPIGRTDLQRSCRKSHSGTPTVASSKCQQWACFSCSADFRCFLGFSQAAREEFVDALWSELCSSHMRRHPGCIGPSIPTHRFRVFNSSWPQPLR